MYTMHRRRLLAGLGAAGTASFGGCVSAGAILDTDEPPSDGNGNTMTYAIEPNTESSGPLRHHLDLLQSNPVSADAPLTIELELTNTTDAAIAYGERRSVLGLYLRDGECMLLSADDDRYAFDASIGRWVAEGPIGITMDYQIDELPAGATHREELVLITGAVDTPEEMVPDRLSFGAEFRAVPATEGIQTIDDSADAFTWGFDLFAH